MPYRYWVSFALVLCSLAIVNCWYLQERYCKGKYQPKLTIPYSAVFSEASSSRAGLEGWILMLCDFMGPSECAPEVKHS